MSVVKSSKIELLESVLKEFTEFRRLSAGKRRAFPVELWDKAVRLCGHYSITQVSRYLNLSYSDLRNRVKEKSPGFCGLKKGVESPSFLELRLPDSVPLSGISDCQYLIELSRVDGSKMRIYSSKANPINLNDLCTTFLRH